MNYKTIFCFFFSSVYSSALFIISSNLETTYVSILLSKNNRFSNLVKESLCEKNSHCFTTLRLYLYTQFQFVCAYKLSANFTVAVIPECTYHLQVDRKGELFCLYLFTCTSCKLLGHIFAFLNVVSTEVKRNCKRIYVDIPEESCANRRIRLFVTRKFQLNAVTSLKSHSIQE